MVTFFPGSSARNQTSISAQSQNPESTEFFQEIHVLFKIFETSTTRRKSRLIPTVQEKYAFRLI